MNNLSTFNQSLLLGFDDLEKMLCQVARPGESFPPYNIEYLDDNNLMISLAVAGYTAQDLEVSLEDTQLIIRGKQEQTIERRYMHKGIAARSFIKTFIMADGMKVTNVSLEYGLLNIVLRRPVSKIKRQILKISTPQESTCVIETSVPHKTPKVVKK